MATAGNKKEIPQAHIDKLLANPGFADDFDKVYGTGVYLLNEARILSPSTAACNTAALLSHQPLYSCCNRIPRITLINIG